MSNILIIKHGSLGDIAQASGAIQDISDNHPNDDLYILSTKPYYDLLKKTQKKLNCYKNLEMYKKKPFFIVFEGGE